jgi:hypothetical protein
MIFSLLGISPCSFPFPSTFAFVNWIQCSRLGLTQIQCQQPFFSDNQGGVIVLTATNF